MADSNEEYHHGNLKEALIEETARIVREEGIDAVSMRSLSDRLDVSRSAAYRHFDGKSALFAKVAKKGFRGLRERLRRVRAESSDNDGPPDQLMSMGQAYVNFALDNPASYRLMFQWNWSEEEFEELSRVGESTFQELISVMEDGQADGSFRSGSPEEMAFSTWGLVHGIALLALGGHAPGLADNPDELTSRLSWIGKGLLTPNPDPSSRS